MNQKIIHEYWNQILPSLHNKKSKKSNNEGFLLLSGFSTKTINESWINTRQESAIKWQITSPMKKGINSNEQINEIHLKFPAWISDVNKLFLESRRLSRIFLSKAYRSKWR